MIGSVASCRFLMHDACLHPRRRGGGRFMGCMSTVRTANRAVMREKKLHTRGLTWHDREIEGPMCQACFYTQRHRQRVRVMCALAGLSRFFRTRHWDFL